MGEGNVGSETESLNYVRIPIKKKDRQRKRRRRESENENHDAVPEPVAST